MYGVVLWSDLSQNKAVFWCEDHGDLAFYHANPETSLTIQMDAGDLVQFEVSQKTKLRTALNPRVICDGLHVELPNRLIAETKPQAADASTQVVPFPDREKTGTPRPQRTGTR